MKTNLNEALNELKLSYSNFHPNLNEVLADLKMQETKYYRTKVISLSEAILKNPISGYQHAELNTSLTRLEGLLTA